MDREETPEQELKRKLEEFRANLDSLASMTPEQKERMQRLMANVKPSEAFAVEMVPDGQYDPIETAARRAVWTLIAGLPKDWASVSADDRQRIAELIAHKQERPIGWVREVLNLPAP